MRHLLWHSSEGMIGGVMMGMSVWGGMMMACVWGGYVVGVYVGGG